MNGKSRFYIFCLHGAAVVHRHSFAKQFQSFCTSKWPISFCHHLQSFCSLPFALFFAQISVSSWLSKPIDSCLTFFALLSASRVNKLCGTFRSVNTIGICQVAVCIWQCYQMSTCSIRKEMLCLISLGQISAYRRSNSFLSGNCHRIWVGWVETLLKPVK